MALQPADVEERGLAFYVDQLEKVIDPHLIQAREELRRGGHVHVLSDAYKNIRHDLYQVHGHALAGLVLAELQRRYHGWDVSYYSIQGEHTGWELFHGLEFVPRSFREKEEG